MVARRLTRSCRSVARVAHRGTAAAAAYAAEKNECKRVGSGGGNSGGRDCTVCWRGVHSNGELVDQSRRRRCRHSPCPENFSSHASRLLGRLERYRRRWCRVQKIVKLICPAAANAFARNATRDAFDARQSRCVPRCARPSAIGASAPGSHLLLFFFFAFCPGDLDGEGAGSGRLPRSRARPSDVQTSDAGTGRSRRGWSRGTL